MNPSFFKQEIQEELSSTVSFLGTNHETIMQHISKQQFSNIVDWLKKL